MGKKAVNSILVVLLLYTTTGYSVTWHFCGDNLVSIELGNNAKNCCDMSMGSCCHEETKHFQLKEDFLSGITQFNLENAFLITVFNFTAIEIIYKLNSENPSANSEFSDSSPPVKVSGLLSFLHTFLL